MTNPKLNAEEQSVLDSYEREEWRSIHKLNEELALYQASALDATKRKGLVGINLSPEDFESIKQKAHMQGVPYQILIANVIHQFAVGQLVEPS